MEDRLCTRDVIQLLEAEDMDVDDFDELVNSLKEQTVEAPRVIVYCCSLDMCAKLYADFHYRLGENYYPPGSDKICSNRLFRMFRASTPANNKDIILKSDSV